MSMTATGAAAAVPGRMRTMSTTLRAASNQKPRGFSAGGRTGSGRATRPSAVDRDHLEDGTPRAGPLPARRSTELGHQQRREALVQLRAIGLVAGLLLLPGPGQQRFVADQLAVVGALVGQLAAALVQAAGQLAPVVVRSQDGLHLLQGLQ